MKLTSFESFLKQYRNKKVTVLGIGVSNTPLIELLLRANASITACDKKTKEALGERADELFQKGVQLKLGSDYLKNIDSDYIFRSPGIRPDLPELLGAQKNGAIITSEMEAFFDICPCRIIAVTGSDGKTTTTTLIYEILKQAGYTCHLGGNIGTPLLSKAEQMKKDDFAIVELSSFQLMTMKKSAHIAVVTNVTPNHLDIHKSMEEYRLSKENVFLYQNEKNMVVLNADNQTTLEMRSRAKGEVRLFSSKGRVQNGAYLKEGMIYFARNGAQEEVVKTSDILIPGAHNVENYMAAISATRDLCKREDIEYVAKNFGGVEHRIEFVRNFQGVSYYNDTIASSPARTIAGLHSFGEKVILIAGGYDKHIPFDALGPEIISHVKKLVLVGATSQKIRDAVINAPGYEKDKLPIHMETEFAKAIFRARDLASDGDVVLFSPACASFDLFPNFAMRGKAFKEIVNSFE